MKYKQTVEIENICFEKATNEFKNINFVKFLTKLQPIKIINWEGIKNNDEAFFKLWFFGWKNFKVKHINYKFNDKELTFIDYGTELPFGLKSWEHKHILENSRNGIRIIDSLKINHGKKIIGLILYPILIFPIVTRKILYKIYFKNI
tara:strand:- start:455 stop:895 length:441 start_codon:yes stop_codon:yes gene_type:complete